MNGIRRVGLAGALATLLLFGASSASARTSHRCVVPRLHGVTLKVARHRIERAHCKIGRIHRPKTASGNLIVSRQVPRAGRKVKRGTKVRLWLKVKSSPVPTLTVPTATTPTGTTATPTVPTPPTAPTVRANLDPSYTQASGDPLNVTWSYDAGVDDGTLPAGTLSLTVYESGQVASAGGCIIDVGGSTTGGNCTLELPQYGSYTVSVTYTGSASTVAPSTETDTETIEPPALTVTDVWGTTAPTANPSVAATIIAGQASVTVNDNNFEGATAISVTDSTGGTCTATVSGTTATCTITDVGTPTSYTLSYPGGTSTTSTASVAPNGTQTTTTEWPAETVTVSNPQITEPYATVMQCGEGYMNGTQWVPPTSCSEPTPNPWTDPTNTTTGMGGRIELFALAYGSLSTDQDPFSGQVAGYLDYTVTGGVEGTDFTETNEQLDPGNSSDCSLVEDQTSGGQNEPAGGCLLVFNTPGIYTVTADYVSQDPNYADASGESITINVS